MQVIVLDASGLRDHLRSSRIPSVFLTHSRDYIPAQRHLRARCRVLLLRERTRAKAMRLPDARNALGNLAPVLFRRVAALTKPLFILLDQARKLRAQKREELFCG